MQTSGSSSRSWSCLPPTLANLGTAPALSPVVEFSQRRFVSPLLVASAHDTLKKESLPRVITHMISCSCGCAVAPTCQEGAAESASE
jgi:hypothetical protein